MNLKKLKQMLIKHEDEVLWPYKCTAGKLTIGIGHNLDAKGISNAVSNLMYEEDINEIINDLHKIFKNFNDLPEQIQLVLADMRFQLGDLGFREFKKLIKSVEHKDWKEMKINMANSLWYKQTNNRAKELIGLVEQVV